MIGYVLKKLALAAAVMFTVSLLAFLLLNLSGDPAIAIAGEGATEADFAVIREQYGLDRPPAVRYLAWMGRMLTGDFGLSTYFKIPAEELILSKLGVTATLGVAALSFGLAIAIPLGVAAGVWKGGLVDRFATLVAVTFQALPTFFVALLLLMVMSVWNRWLPVQGGEGWRLYVMPAMTLGFFVMPPLLRLVRSNMIDALRADYVRTARAKGLSPLRIVARHALGNAILPVISLTAVQLGYLIGGSVIIESIFSLDGLGYLAYRSIELKDLPVLQATVLLLSLVYVGLTTAADLINAALDPRIGKA